MEKIFNKAVAILFCLIIFAVPILTKLETPTEYSIHENRNLASPPVFTYGTLLNGEYLPRWNDYYSDHIWKRNYFIIGNTYMNMHILNKPVVNNVVIQNELLLPFVDYTDTEYNYAWQAEVMGGMLEQVNECAQAYGGRFIYIGVPEQMSMLREYYPKYLNNSDEQMTEIEREFTRMAKEKEIGFINMREVFSSTGNPVEYYSRTDHHYNLYGAFLTYQTLIRRINDDYGAGLPVLSGDDIEFIELKNPFYGSRNRKLYRAYPSNEHLTYAVMKNPIPFTRSDNGQDSGPSVFALPPDETSPATYDIYMGGDIGETVIKTNRSELPNALIFGDSFTNPLETFLYASFNETVSLDLRHYDKKTILEYIEEYRPGYVFCLRDDTAYFSFDGNGDIK